MRVRHSVQTTFKLPTYLLGLPKQNYLYNTCSETKVLRPYDVITKVDMVQAHMRMDVVKKIDCSI